MNNYILSDVIEKMLTELSGVSRASQNTIDAYRRDLKHFTDFCTDKKAFYINTITEKNIRFYLMNLSESGLDKSSISRKLSSLRRLFNCALRNELIEINPIAKIPQTKTAK